MDNRIEIKWIKQIINWTQFEKELKLLTKKIAPFKSKYDFIYGIPRGGLVIAVWLSHHLEIPLITNDFELYQISKILIVDDIADTGKTLQKFKYFDSATVYYKSRSIIKPTYYSIKTKNWIVFPYELETEKENREPLKEK